MKTIRSMPFSVKLATFWLVAISAAAALTALASAFSFESLLPIQDPLCQLNLPLPCADGIDAGKFDGPNLTNFLGTDNLSRDIFSRIVYGAQVSLGVVVGAILIGMTIGGVMGSLVGFVQGKTDSIVMTMVDMILAFPPLVLLLVLATQVGPRDNWLLDLFIGERTILFVATIIGVLAIPQYARVARANALAISRREFVMAAEAIGTKRSTILFREVIPNVFPTLLAYGMVVAARVIVVEGALAFLSLSVPLPKPSWGSMINQSRSDIKQTILPTVWPSLALIFTVLALNTLGDWMRQRNAGRAAAL